MEIEATFRVGDDPQKKLTNARICAEELCKVKCSWHSHCAQVGVVLDEKGELRWKVSDCCCDNMKKEIVKAIEDVTPRL